MKKVFSILALAAIISCSATAQSTFKKSDKFAEGTASYSKAEGSDGTYGVQPTIGYFVNDKIAIGLTGNFAKGTDSKTSNIGAFGRLYFLNLGKNFKVFSQLSVVSSSETVASEKTTGVGFDMGLGMNYFFTDRLALSTNLAGLMSYNSGDSEFNIGFNGVNNPLVAPSFGVLYKF